MGRKSRRIISRKGSRKGATLAGTGELALVRAIRNRFSARSKDVAFGIGDDAAVYKTAPGKKILATTDLMAEGVHFDLAYITPRQLGFKLVSVNASDIFAMGGKPRHLLLSLAMPATLGMDFVSSFLDGVEDGIKLYGMTLSGGDVSSSVHGLVLNATVLGYALKPVMRSGAKPGDGIFVTGALGDSACGLEILRRLGRPVELGRKSALPGNIPISRAEAEPFLRRHLMPEARRPGAWLKHATAMIDVSDGLLIDLSRLCEESRAGACIESGAIPRSRGLAKACASLGFDAMGLALSGGEDYELLFTAPDASYRGATRIGAIRRGRGLVLVEEGGSSHKVEPKGYEHFGSGGRRWH